MNTMELSDTALDWLQTLLEERFGNKWILTYEKEYLVLRASELDGAIFFPRTNPFSDCSIKTLPCLLWNAKKEGWNPVINETIPAPGLSNLIYPMVELKHKQAQIRYNVMHLIFWCLTRQEETYITELDRHQRVRAVSTHAFNYGYLERPIVDEWLCIISQIIERIWPTLKLKTNSFRVTVSHDVDEPSAYYYESWGSIFRNFASLLLKKKNFSGALKVPIIKLSNKNYFHNDDPYNSFRWLMDVSEDNDIQSTFYFICNSSNTLYDAKYKLTDPKITSLIKSIVTRGHNIGLHPSYNCFSDPELLKNEAMILKSYCNSNGINQSLFGARMHYLRWDQRITLAAYDSAGLDYDSSMTFADRAGFRCGTCFDYQAFDVKNDTLLNFRIRPLIVMEASVLDDCYMGLGETDLALEKMLQLKNTCRAVKGTFSVLWHNSRLVTHQSKRIYRDLIEN